MKILKSKIVLINITVSLLFLFSILYFIKFDFLKKISFISVKNNYFLIIAFLFYTLSTTFRASRFQNIFFEKSFFKSLNFNSSFQFISRIVPFRIGEFLFPLLVNHYFGSKIIFSFKNLLILRYYDLLATIFLALICLSFIRYELIFFIPFIFCINIILKNKLFYSKFKFNNLNYNKLLLLSFSEKTFTLFSFYFIIKSLNADFSFFVCSLGYSLSSLTDLLPISFFGNFGSFELAWTALLSLYEINSISAFNYGFTGHIIILLFLPIISLISYILFKIVKSYN